MIVNEMERQSIRREFTQRRPQRQKCAYLTRKKSSFARFEGAFVILCISLSSCSRPIQEGEDLFCSCVDDCVI